MSKKKLSFDINVQDSCVDNGQEVFDQIVDDIKAESEVDVVTIVDLHLNVYLKPATKELLMQSANRNKNETVKLCQYANLSESALLGYIKQLG